MMMAVAAVAVHPVTHMARAGATTQEVREYLRLHDVAVGDSEGDERQARVLEYCTPQLLSEHTRAMRRSVNVAAPGEFPYVRTCVTFAVLLDLLCYPCSLTRRALAMGVIQRNKLLVCDASNLAPCDSALLPARLRLVDDVSNVALNLAVKKPPKP